MPMPVEPVPALTSDPVYLAILYPDLFGLDRGCQLAYSIRNRFLHSPVTLCT